MRHILALILALTTTAFGSGYFGAGGSSSAATWGSITGTLSSQTDLQTSLSGKVDSTGSSISTTLTMAGSSGANFLWTTDGAGRIGGGAINRPNEGYFKTSVNIGQTDDTANTGGGVTLQKGGGAFGGQVRFLAANSSGNGVRIELTAAKVLQFQDSNGTEFLRLGANYIRPVGINTATRDALTAVDGMLIYNSETTKFQGRAGGAWVDLH